MSAAGWRGEARLHALGTVMLSTLWVWSRDASEDMSATMAHLYRQLRRAESMLALVRRAVPAGSPAKA